ncbi:TetR/AcrR family transcriptional regulator [Chondromyces crocatus]|uniref:HTH tetR-type domain-containing protein n=1 Tax=Chondromyces crocatus TaxID=52 RepID=A0A0K1ED70_CHOCO|nr:TetR/AcrR family transcriptional regulator [Chondromyces crocatus]AKT38826.1 uncharacterized protein CMC5_029720 [Chondromyces crocatus]
MTRDARSKPSTAEPRQRQLLEAALGVFIRYGFRKTSMDEVARAAQVSRQGLYLHFATKEELFRATLQHAFETALEEALGRLGDESAPLHERLTGAFDAWIGRYVGVFGADAADLNEASKALGGASVSDHEKSLLDAVAKVLRASGLVAAYRPAGITARQLAETLNATGIGLKHRVATRAEFVEGMRIAARAVCLSLERS